jgi:hypothetical protein
VTGRLSPPTNAFITRSSVGRARRAKHKTASRGTRLAVHGLMCKARQGSSKGALLVLQVGCARGSLLVHRGSPQSPFDACRTAALLLTNNCYLPTYLPTPLPTPPSDRSTTALLLPSRARVHALVLATSPFCPTPRYTPPVVSPQPVHLRSAPCTPRPCMRPALPAHLLAEQ